MGIGAIYNLFYGIALKSGKWVCVEARMSGLSEKIIYL